MELEKIKYGAVKNGSMRRKEKGKKESFNIKEMRSIVGTR